MKFSPISSSSYTLHRLDRKKQIVFSNFARKSPQTNINLTVSLSCIIHKEIKKREKKEHT